MRLQNLFGLWLTSPKVFVKKTPTKSPLRFFLKNTGFMYKQVCCLHLHLQLRKMSAYFILCSKALARLVSMLRGFFTKLVSLRERGWQVPERHFTELHKVKPSRSRGHLQGNPNKLKQSSLLHWPLCGTCCALGEIRLLHVIHISYPQLLLENFRL